MKITVTKVIRELQENHGWSPIEYDPNNFLINALIKDVLKIIDQKLKYHKGISIK
jgi:hypothetical protein